MLRRGGGFVAGLLSATCVGKVGAIGVFTERAFENDFQEEFLVADETAGESDSVAEAGKSSESESSEATETQQGKPVGTWATTVSTCGEPKNDLQKIPDPQPNVSAPYPSWDKDKKSAAQNKAFYPVDIPDAPWKIGCRSSCKAGIEGAGVRPGPDNKYCKQQGCQFCDSCFPKLDFICKISTKNANLQPGLVPPMRGEKKDVPSVWRGASHFNDNETPGDTSGKVVKYEVTDWAREWGFNDKGQNRNAHIFRQFPPNFVNLEAEVNFAKGGGILWRGVQPKWYLDWLPNDKGLASEAVEKEIQKTALAIRQLAPARVLFAPGWEPDGHLTCFGHGHELFGAWQDNAKMISFLQRRFKQYGATNVDYLIDFSSKAHFDYKYIDAVKYALDSYENLDWIFFNMFQTHDDGSYARATGKGKITAHVNSTEQVDFWMRLLSGNMDCDALVPGAVKTMSGSDLKECESRYGGKQELGQCCDSLDKAAKKKVAKEEGRCCDYAETEDDKKACEAKEHKWAENSEKACKDFLNHRRCEEFKRFVQKKTFKTSSGAEKKIADLPWGLGAWGSNNRKLDPNKTPIMTNARKRFISDVTDMVTVKDGKMKYPKLQSAIYFNSLDSLVKNVPGCDSDAQGNPAKDASGAAIPQCLIWNKGDNANEGAIMGFGVSSELSGVFKEHFDANGFTKNDNMVRIPGQQEHGMNGASEEKEDGE